jgi:hypothetical protein
MENILQLLQKLQVTSGRRSTAGNGYVITKLKDKQDGSIIITFHNKEIFGVYILLNLIVFSWGGFEDHNCNPVCLV